MTLTEAELAEARRDLARLHAAGAVTFAPVSPIKPNAAYDLARARQRGRERRARLLAAGLCVQCGQRPAFEGRPRCAPCGVAHRLYVRGRTGAMPRAVEPRGKTVVYPGEAA